MAASIVLVVAAGAADWAAGTELSVLLLYFPGVALAAWRLGRAGGLAAAALAGLCWLAADLLARHVYVHSVAPYWNAGVRLGVFAVVALLVAELRRARERERALLGGEGEVQGMTSGGPFYELAEAEFARLARHGRPFTLAYVDVGVVPVQTGDPLGEPHAARVLEVLRANLRGSDLVARPRGREFALLLVETGPEAARVALGRVCSALEAGECCGGGTGLAVGAVVCTAAGGEFTHVVQRAYQLMYTAERSDGCVALHVEAMEPVPAPSAAA